MTLVDDISIADAIRGMADTPDERYNDRLRSLADHIDAELEQRQREVLGEQAELGGDVLTMWRTIEGQHRRLLAHDEEHKRLYADIRECRASIASLQAAQAPEILEERLRALEGRRKGISPAERAQAIRETIAALQRVLQEVEQEALQEIAVGVQTPVLDLRDAVEALRAGLGAVQAQIQELQHSKETT